MVILGGSSGIWYNTDEPDYGFQNRPRYKLNMRESYDVALIKPGRYELKTIVLNGNGLPKFGGISGLGQSDSQNYATFTVTPGQVVYVGDFLTQVRQISISLCIASLAVGDNTQAVASSLQANVPYLTGKPISTSVMDIEQDEVRFPPPCY